MGYRRTLSFGWAQRDTLGVVVIALTASFLIGAAVLGVALGDQTTAVAAEYETTYGLSPATTDTPSSADAATFIFGETPTDDGSATIVGIDSRTSTIAVRGQQIGFPAVERGRLATVSVGDNPAFAAEPGRSVVTRQPHPLFPDTWYVTHPETARDLGNTEFYRLYSATNPETPLLSVLLFFVYGSAELISILRLATIGGGLLVGVTVFSVVRLSVRERRPDIRVLRSTGAQPRQIIGIYALRALVLTSLGISFGFGFGFIFIRGVVNVALASGLPTTLNARLTPDVLGILLPAGGLFLIIGGVAGVIAAGTTTVGDPRRQTDAPNVSTQNSRFDSRLRGLVATRFLGWSTLVPTAATLTVFMCALLVLTAVAGAFGPLAADDGQTITEPDTPHPVASNVPVSYADALRAQGAEASPEILLFEVYRGDPIVARGVNFSAYRSFSGIELTAGELPAHEGEALIGTDLARTTGLAVGDTIVLGGSTAPAITRITIAGTFGGRGIQDDQLLVGLPTARHLADRPEGSAHFVRARGLPTTAGNTSTIVVTDARLTRQNGQTGVVLTATNLGLRDATRRLDVSVGERTKSATVTLPSRGTSQQFVPFELQPTETYRLVVGEIDKQTSLAMSASAGGTVGTPRLTIDAPDPVPTNSTPQLVVTRNGVPVANATVVVENTTTTTNEQGATRVRFTEAGDVRVTAATGTNRTATTVTVGANAPRRVESVVSITPAAPSIFTQPEATVRVRNPWRTDRRPTVAIVGPSSETVRNVTVPPGQTVTLTTALPRQPAGTYDVSVRTNGEARTTTTYTVRGDERLGTALAASGRYSGGSGITRAIQIVFGNIEALVVAIVSLLSIMTVGSMTAAFTRAVQMSKREIGIRRATGAAPRDIYVAVLADALKVGVVASGLSLALGFAIVQGLLSAGELRVFGLVLSPILTPTVIVGSIGAGVGVAAVSALLAAVKLLRAAPAALFVDRNISTSDQGGN